MSAGSPSELADPVAVARVTASTVLIGASACSGAFSEALVREVGLHDPAPIVLPLSNPGACAEARPEDILAWTGGRPSSLRAARVARSPVQAASG